MATTIQLPVIAFDSARSWQAWLAKHHARSPGVWLRIYKKDSAKPSVTYAEALAGALCYGWIDSQKQPRDSLSRLQKFGPAARRVGGPASTPRTPNG